MSNLDVRLKPFLLTWAIPVGLVATTAVVLGGLIAWLGSTAYILVLGMLGVIAVALIGTRYERIPFYVLVASLALGQVLSVEDLPTTLLIVPGGLAIGAWLSKLAIRRTSVVIDRRSMALAILLAFWATLSALNAGGVGTARSYWLVVILFLLTPNVIREERHFVELGWVLTLSLAMVGGAVLSAQAQAYLSGIVGGWALHLHAQREVAFEVSGILGMRLTKAIPFALYIAFGQTGIRSWQRYLLVFCVLLIALAVLSTVSLSAALALGGTFLLLVLWVRRHPQRFWLILVMGTVLVIGSSLVMGPLLERVTEQVTTVEQENPLYWGTYRGLSWYVGWELIQQSPLLGQGPGESAEASVTYLSNELFQSRMREEGVIPHNLFLSLGAELGIPGLLAFIALLASVMVPLWREIQRRQGTPQDTNFMFLYMGQATLIGLVMVLAQGMGIPIHLDKYLWLLLGIGAAFVHVSRSKNLAIS